MKDLLNDIAGAIFILCLVLGGILFIFPDIIIGSCMKIINETDYPIFIKLIAAFILISIILLVVFFSLWMLVDIIKPKSERDSGQEKEN